MGPRVLNKKQRGFTIVELLIATLVFSVVLLVITVGILQIARVYYKGVTESNTQNTARTIIDTISQSIQFSGGAVSQAPGSVTTANPTGVTPGASNAICVGNQQFSYTLGYQVDDSPSSAKHQTYHALVQTSATGTPCSSTSGAQDVRLQVVTGRELISPHMRIADLVVAKIAGTSSYSIRVKVVYGDDDLLVSPSTAGPTAPTKPDIACKPTQKGTQFCAVSELSTVVQKRVE
jgi:prepilin-type N-terminal cleavage/methylation domain-containing protein